jgi:hypothetical protein
LEQRHATVLAPVHLPVRTAAYDAFDSCISVGCLYLASSFARRKNQTQRNTTTGLSPLAHYVHIPVKPIITDRELALINYREKELNTIAIEVKESYTIASYLKNQIP